MSVTPQTRQRAGKGTDWGQLKRKDLARALAAAIGSTDQELIEPLRYALAQCEIARFTGDDMAHANPFIVLEVLDLLDPETGRIRRGTTTNRLLNPTGQLVLMDFLLVLHAAALARHDPQVIPLRNIIETLGKDLHDSFG